MTAQALTPLNSSTFKIWVDPLELCLGGVEPEIRLRLRVQLTLGPQQATLSKLLTFCMLRPTHPPILSGTGNK